jgi:hypothetical protein
MAVATFAEVFAYTLFAHAQKRTGTFANIGVKPFPAPKVPTEEITDSQAPRHAIWHFDHDPKKTPASITNLTCLSRGMGNGRMTVANAVTLEQAAIKTVPSANGKVASVDIDLPLKPEFVILNGYLKTSTLPADSHFLYPLPAEIDLSMAVVFGYEFKDGPTSAPTVIANERLNDAGFMPTPGAGSTAPPTVGQGQLAKVVVAPLRAIVCFSFVTAKERADFEPGELLGAGRIWPHTLIMANRDLAETRAVTRVERPATLTMDGGDHSTHAEMNLNIEACLFSDSNIGGAIAPGGPPSPYWDDLFAVYDVGVTSGTTRASDPLEKGGTISGAVQVLKFLETSYKTVNVPRVPRQGAYDNIHVAPTMKASTAASHPGMFLDRIYMAPFCEHDCLHTHWRWASSNSKRAVLGWATTGKDPRIPGHPYKAAGAPMVPANQTVSIEITGASSFRYHAKAIGKDGVDASTPIPAGTFSTFFHHGMAYAVQLDSVAMQVLDSLIDAQAITKGEPDLGGTSATTSISVRYWRLRWGGDDQVFSPDVVNERLKVLDRAKLLKRASP